MSSSARALFLQLRQQLSTAWPDTELNPLVYWLMEHYLQLSRAAILADKPLNSPLPPELSLALDRLQAGEPIQYILGEAPFYGNTFHVSPAVLIPRPETEELVNRILERHEHSPGLHALDVGTGSGCIAISLALHLPEAKVWALDVSTEALAVAQENASRLQAPVGFLQDDILKRQQPLPTELDILVSNPPYVRQSESARMLPHVLNWEPASALFVPDADPLLFYRALAREGRDLLKAGGWLYFEINEAYGRETARLLKDSGYAQVNILHDLNGKARMLEGRKKN